MRGSNIVLSAHFLDANLSYTDPSDLLISVYPPGKDPEDPDVTTDDAWVYNVSLTSGGEGPYADPLRLAVRESAGKYTFTFLIPEDSELGAGFDRWEGTVDLEELDSTFSFTIVGGGSVGTTQLYDNNIVYLTLSENIAATDGSTLGDEVFYYFTTTYDPLYSSLRRIRLDLGAMVTDVPDETIYLAILEASLQAEVNDFFSSIGYVNEDYFKSARREYTTCLAESMLVQGLMGDSGLSDRMSKTLADLSVSRGGGYNRLSDQLNRLQDCVARWQVALQNGGGVTPETSLRPGYSVKGAWAADVISVGRQWEPTSGIFSNSGTSAANTSKYKAPRRRLRTFRSRGSD